jgi:hypothetical protein
MVSAISVRKLTTADVAIQLLEGDNSLLPVVLPLLSPQTKVTIQHSVIGLVRNLANPPENKVILGEAGVVDRLIGMEVFSDKRDMVGTVQGGSAGLIKLLCQNNRTYLLYSNAVTICDVQP